MLGKGTGARILRIVGILNSVGDGDRATADSGRTIEDTILDIRVSNTGNLGSSSIRCIYTADVKVYFVIKTGEVCNADGVFIKFGDDNIVLLRTSCSIAESAGFLRFPVAEEFISPWSQAIRTFKTFVTDTSAFKTSAVCTAIYIFTRVICAATWCEK